MYQVAIVDDNESWCFILATRLRQHGYAVSTFTDADRFLRDAAQFDLALIDFSMPPRRYQVETDGPDVIRKLKQRLAQPPLTVLISSFFTEDILKDVADLGLQADVYLSKSIDAQELLRQIENLLATKRSQNSDETNDGDVMKPQSQSSRSTGTDPARKAESQLNQFSRSH